MKYGILVKYAKRIKGKREGNREKEHIFNYT
jgi:hypothetical protein